MIFLLYSITCMFVIRSCIFLNFQNQIILMFFMLLLLIFSKAFHFRLQIFYNFKAFKFFKITLFAVHFHSIFHWKIRSWKTQCKNTQNVNNVTKCLSLLNLDTRFLFFATSAGKDVEAADYENDLQKIAMTISIPWQKDTWVAVKYENKWYPGFIKEVTENIFFAVLVTVTVITVYTYNKYLELLVRIKSDVRSQPTSATTATKTFVK